MTKKLRAKKQKTASNGTPPAADEAVKTSSEEDTQFTEKLSILLFIQPYKSSNVFYVREGYEEYYQLMKKMLLTKTDKCVTVTGTSGIGK
ncbi:uncharacterized protein PITG_00865 [Phytophthora infestans T30-4]|uniref:Uncharacterized protein n=1 Tax=Phytophthora infestans (strain T30-4) TaxID=403677 RepID=D0MRV8_PHYIT|nr:uncharacterized protein PITG_00865 [Phytophthora infestans T30-4]EEY58227.1 hypothetical protein PITG_00865 [Phytophthora infestans T30-4]KAI9996544.1 hypothetical protein PInf_014276 [Phytophthora infestans]|eukprot:XP_002909413.1 hypothetical protein PITG_00865 [Phytophthora infestans T30-4]